MLRRILLSTVIVLAACGGELKPAAPEPVSLTPSLVVTGPRVANLEVRIFPQRPLGQARLTLSAPGIEILPKSQVDFVLTPPPPPPRVEHSPYPLPLVILQVFRLQAAAAGSHTLTLTLSWPGGELKRDIQWNDTTERQP